MAAEEAKRAEDPKSREEKITQFFRKWTPTKLATYFGKRTEKLLEFGEAFIMICLKDISHGNPAHLNNAAMNECISGFDEWSQHVAAGNRALIWKLIHNGQILHHQCKRYEWYNQVGDENETKKMIAAIVEEDGQGQSFMTFLKKWNGRYLRRKASERPADENVLKALDAWMDLENPENKDVKIAFNGYRFFGASIPVADMVERWMEFNKESIPDLVYKDRVYLPVIRLESKLLFQHFKNKNQPHRCRGGLVTMDWSSNESFIESMKAAVGYLAAQKEQYEAKRRGRRGRQRMDDELTDDEVATTEDEEDEEEDPDDVDDDAKRPLEPRSKGKRGKGLGAKSKAEEEDEVEEDDTDDLSPEDSENEEEETIDDTESENEDIDRNRNRKDKEKRKGAAKRKGRNKGKGTGGRGSERGRSGKGIVRSFKTMLEAADWEYDPDNVPAPPTKKRSTYNPVNDDADSSETEEEIMSSVKYESLKLLQRAQKNESKILIFDTSKPTRFYGFSALALISYMRGEQSWAIALGLDVAGHGCLAFKDTDWDRDMVAVLVKMKNQMSEDQIDAMVDILLDELDDIFIEMLLKTMVKRTATQDEKEQDEDDVKSLSALEAGPGHDNYNVQTRKSILKLWLGDAVVGPFAITRSFSIQKVDNIACLLGPVSAAVRNRMIQPIFHERVDHITVLDDEYFMITGRDAFDMKWPDDVTCDFVAIADQGQKVAVKHVQRLETFPAKYVAGRPKTAENSYTVAVYQDDQGKYLKMEYGGSVFGDINGVIARIVNTESFTTWVKSKTIGLDLWYGRDEQDKIQDHRNLIKMYKELQAENRELKAALQKGKRGRK